MKWTVQEACGFDDDDEIDNMTFKSNTPRSEFGSPKIEKTKRILTNHMHLYSGRVNQTSPCKIRGMCLAFSSAEDTSGSICKHPINHVCFYILKIL
ncbi:hypothetical protein Peur_011490 [Populus x canadensis]